MWKLHKTSILLGLGFIALLSAFWYLQSFAFVYFLSLLLTLLLLDPVDKLAAHRIPRGMAALIMLAIFLVLFLGLISVVSKSFIPTLGEFTDELPNLAGKLQQLNLMIDSDIVSQGIDEAWKEMTTLTTQAIRSSLLIAVSLFSKLIDFVIIIFLTFYMLMDGEKIKAFIAGLFPTKDKQRVVNLMAKILGSLRAYIRSQCVICLITGSIVYLYFTARGLEYASVFAVSSAVSEFIPVLGPTVASCFGILMTALHSPDMAIQTAVFYLVLTQINHNLVYPAIVGRSLHLHPVATILGIILGGELLDAAGMFLAVPFMVVIKHVIEDINEYSHFM